MMRLLPGILLIALATSVPAATFTVDSTLDAVDSAPGNGVCATAAGACSLRAAVQEANALAGADTITLPAGTFLLSLVGDGENAAATGDLDVLQPLTITGAGRDLTIIDGASADRVLHVPGTALLTLQGLTIRNGLSAASSGGGVLNETGAPLTVTDVTFRGNRANGGGAVLIAGAPLLMTGVLLEDNVASSSGGAVVHLGGSSEVRDCVFRSNVAPPGQGGAYVYAGTDPVTISGSTFSGNLAGTAGAISINGGPPLTVTDTVVEDNHAISAVAGGIYLTDVANPTFQNVTIRRNTSDMAAGGIAIVATGVITIRGSTIADNQTQGGGGGAYISSPTASSLVVENTTVSGNRSLTDTGGGLRAELAMGSLTLRGVVAEDNATGMAVGGIVGIVGGTATIERSRFTNNTANGGPVGGLYVASPTAITLTDSTFQGNRTTTVGGGGYLASGAGPVVVERNTFADNLAFGAPGLGGGLFVQSATTSIINSTFSGNWAQGFAGGLLLSGVTAEIANSTFFGNTSGMPGAAFAGPGVAITVRSTAIGAGPVASCDLGHTSTGDNVDQDGSCLLAGPRDRNGIDPLLGPLQDNGGPTFTHEPLAASPLVDGVGGGTCPPLDQRSVARPTDGNGDGTAACDIGAVEFVDECLADPDKRLPGVCGCGVPDVDANANGAVDCLINAELKARIATSRTVMASLTGVKSDAETAARAELTALADGLLSYCTTNEATIVLTDPSAKLIKLAKKARKALRATRKGKGGALTKKKARATKALDALDGVVAP